MIAVAALFAGCGVPPDPSREQPVLSNWAQSYVPALQQAGISKIVSWSDRPEQPVQVMSTGGPVYFPYAPGVSLVRFALTVDGGRAMVKSDDYAPDRHQRYVATMDWVLRESLRFTTQNSTRLETKEKASR
jgi:hypothetical protein